MIGFRQEKEAQGERSAVCLPGWAKQSGLCDDAGKEGKKMNEKKKGYIGSIQNSGAQKVKAPVAAGGKKGNNTVKTGTDLRSGK